MDIWVYVLVAVLSALIIFLISLNVRIIICFENGKLEYYAKILGIKKKISLKKKKESSSLDNSSQDSILYDLFRLRNALFRTLGLFIRKIHIKLVKLKVVIAGENAAQAALLYGSITPVISTMLEFFDNISNVDVNKNADICVTTDFLSKESIFEGKIKIRLNVIRYLRWKRLLFK